MTFWRFAAMARRRWIAVVLGVFATALGGLLVLRQPGVYYQEAIVVFIAPNTAGNPAAFQLGASSLVSSAALVGRQVDGGSSGPLALSPKTSIVDLGVRHGTWIRLPNAGGQWRTNFNKEELDVQSVGATREEAETRMSTVLAQIRAVLRQGQLAAGAPKDQLITVAVTPQSIPVTYRKGSPARALAATLALGTGLTVTLVLLADRAAVIVARRRDDEEARS